MKIKKILLSCLALTLTGLTIAGCGQQNNAKQNNSDNNSINQNQPAKQQKHHYVASGSGTAKVPASKSKSNIQDNSNSLNSKIKSNPMSGWQAGLPSVFSKKSFWISNFMPANNKDDDSSKISYTRTLTPLGGHFGFNPTQFQYNAKHKCIGNGADESAGAAINPHFKSLGNNMYLITSGSDKKGNNSLHYELNNNLNHMFGSTVLVKVIDSNHIQTWIYDEKKVNKPYYINPRQTFGTYTRYPSNLKLVDKILGDK